MPSHAPTPKAEVTRPRGILKNASSCASPPPVSPVEPKNEKELTQMNTQINAGSRRSSSAARHPVVRRLSQPAEHDENAPRLKWDEANLYLTEQERTAKMKIDEPKTPFVHHYNLDNETDMSEDEDIPGMSLGEPEEAIPEAKAPSPKANRAVHVDEEMAAGHETEALDGLSPQELEKHHKFEEMRKKHYDMKNVAALLAHAAEEEEDEDEELGDAPPPMPPMPAGLK